MAINISDVIDSDRKLDWELGQHGMSFTDIVYESNDASKRVGVLGFDYSNSQKGVEKVEFKKYTIELNCEAAELYIKVDAIEPENKNESRGINTDGVKAHLILYQSLQSAIQFLLDLGALGCLPNGVIFKEGFQLTFAKDKKFIVEIDKKKIAVVNSEVVGAGNFVYKIASPDDQSAKYNEQEIAAIFAVALYQMSFIVKQTLYLMQQQGLIEG
jgi:hypothetical protein